MATFSLRAEWSESREFLKLDFGALREGSLVPTRELWDDGIDVTYRAEVVSITQPEPGALGKYRVVLRYDEHAEHHLPLRDMDIVWGDFGFEVDTTDWTATAGHVVLDADDPAEVAVLASDLLPTELETVTRVKRIGQDILRADLLLLDGGCAITGETFEHVLEAAHIRDAADDGPAEWDNCFLLRIDLHRLYDKGLLTISPKGVVKLTGAPKEAQSMYGNAPLAALNPKVLQRVGGALAWKAEWLKRSAAERKAERAKKATQRKAAHTATSSQAQPTEAAA